VLLSTDFRYYGARGTADYKTRYRALGRAIAALKRGHRINHGAAVLKDLLALQHAAWKANRQRRIGQPTQNPNPHVSQRGGACAKLEARPRRTRRARKLERC
jgi:hypothetical protein